MGVEYGIIIDVFQNPIATLESAREALKTYEDYRGEFHLVGVAHGGSVDEYMKSYSDLKEMGFTHVAVGSLIRKRGKSVRYTHVDDEIFMYKLLSTLRTRYPTDWLFALGSLHPSRVEEFNMLEVWGDYKGWIFKYEKRNEILNAKLNKLVSNYLEHLNANKTPKCICDLRRTVVQRERLVLKQKALDQQLFAGSRTLRVSLSSLHQELQRKRSKVAARFKILTTHALINAKEEREIEEALAILDKQKSKEAKNIREQIRSNHDLKKQVVMLEGRINQVNKIMAERIGKLNQRKVILPDNTRRLCSQIVRLINTTERVHRFRQVRRRISQRILAQLS